MLRRRFPAQLKIGPVEKIRDLVTLQLPGVPVSPLPVAPRQIPFHTGFAYFELDQNNELWEQLKSSGGLAMHVAGEFPGLAMELKSRSGRALAEQKEWAAHLVAAGWTVAFPKGKTPFETYAIAWGLVWAHLGIEEPPEITEQDRWRLEQMRMEKRLNKKR